MRELTPRELEIVLPQKKRPKPILDLPDDPVPITDEIENWIILLPANVREGLIQTIKTLMNSTSKVSPLDLRVMGELRDSQNLYFSKKADYHQREVLNVNDLLGYIQNGITLAGESLNGITPTSASQFMGILKYCLDSPQHTYEWMEYEARFNDFYIRHKQNNDLVEADQKILKAWMKVLGEYAGNFVPTELFTTLETKQVEPPEKKYANTPSPYKYNVSSSIEKKKIRDLIIEVARAHSYPENWLLAQIWHESSYNPKARNPKSTAAGLGQFLKDTGKEYGLDPWPEGFFDPERNSTAVIKMMSGLMKQATKWGASNKEEAWKYALAGYYAGSGYIIRDLISQGYVKGRGMRFMGPLKPFTWNNLESSLTGPHARETQKYVSSISKLSISPP